MKHLDGFTVTGEMSEPIVDALRNLLAVMENSCQTSNSLCSPFLDALLSDALTKPR